MPRILHLITVVTCALSLTVGCGAAERNAPPSSGLVNAEFTARVQQIVDEVSAPQHPLELAPNPATGARHIAVISVTLAETGALRTARALTEAIFDIGWTSTTYDGQGSPTVANQKLEQAINARPDAIVLISLDPTDVGSGLAAARAANIPVSCAACWDLSSPDQRGLHYADVTPPISVFQDLGYLTAAYSFLETDGHPRFLTMNDPALSNLSARMTGFRRFMTECTQAAADCLILASRDFQVANATTTLAAEGAHLAQANPTFNAFWVSFDFAALQVLTGLRQAGLTQNTQRFLVASNGDGPNLQVIESIGSIRATVAISFEQEAYALVDNLNRIFKSENPIPADVPIRLFTADNAHSADNGRWSGDVDYRAAYRQAWGDQ
jgi:ribose transport system substrate-binding protein